MNLTQDDLNQLLVIICEEVEVAVDRAVVAAVDKAVGPAVDKAVDNAVGPAVYRAVGSAVDASVDRAVGPAVDRAVAPAIDRALNRSGRSFRHCNDIKDLYGMDEDLNAGTITDEAFKKPRLEDKLLIINAEPIAAARQAGIAPPGR